MIGYDIYTGHGRVNAGRALELTHAPYVLQQHTTTGGTSQKITSGDGEGLVFMNDAGTTLPEGWYYGQKYQVTQTVDIPLSGCNERYVWTRTAGATIGWSAANPNNNLGFSHIVSETETTVTLRTYVYYIKYNFLGQTINAWYPTSPQNAVMAYTTLINMPITSTVTGPSFVCSSGASFTVNNLPAGVTIEWAQGPYLTRTSAQGSNPCTFSATGAGSSWVRATLVTGCGSVPLPQKTVWAGAPVISYILGPTYTPNYQWATYYAEPNNSAMGVNDYSWILNPLNDNVVYDNGWTADIAFYSSGNYQLVVRGQNTCGWGDYAVTGIEVYDSKRLSIFPNPAGGEVTLTIGKSVEEELPVSGWDLEIYAPNMMLKAKKTGVKDTKTTINTAGWQEGIYMVRVKYDGSFLSGRLVVQH